MLNFAIGWLSLLPSFLPFPSSALFSGDQGVNLLLVVFYLRRYLRPFVPNDEANDPWSALAVRPGSSEQAVEGK